MSEAWRAWLPQASCTRVPHPGPVHVLLLDGETLLEAALARTPEGGTGRDLITQLDALVTDYWMQSQAPMAMIAFDAPPRLPLARTARLATDVTGGADATAVSNVLYQICPREAHHGYFQIALGTALPALAVLRQSMVLQWQLRLMVSRHLVRHLNGPPHAQQLLVLDGLWLSGDEVGATHINLRLRARHVFNIPREQHVALAVGTAHLALHHQYMCTTIPLPRRAGTVHHMEYEEARPHLHGEAVCKLLSAYAELHAQTPGVRAGLVSDHPDAALCALLLERHPLDWLINPSDGHAWQLRPWPGMQHHLLLGLAGANVSPLLPAPPRPEAQESPTLVARAAHDMAAAVHTLAGWRRDLSVLACVARLLRAQFLLRYYDAERCGQDVRTLVDAIKTTVDGKSRWGWRHEPLVGIPLALAAANAYRDGYCLCMIKGEATVKAERIVPVDQVVMPPELATLRYSPY